MSELEQLRAENERLREALRKIGRTGIISPGATWPTPRDMARAALSEQESK